MTKEAVTKALTRVGFGGAAVGNLYRAVSDEDALEAIEAAWEGGVRYFDTAPHYGLGLSERRLGDALARHPRNRYVLSTKVGRVLEPNPTPTGSDLAIGGFEVPDALARRFDYTRTGVLRSLEESLSRLGTDYIDIVYVHDPDEHMDEAVNVAIPTLLRLRDEGVVGAVGAGMNSVAPLRRFARECDVDVLMVAGRWTLIDRTAADLMSDCRARGVGVVVAAPFNSGLLAHAWPPDDAHYNYALAPRHVVNTARECARVCASHQTTLPAAALQFPLRDQVVLSVVVGMADRTEAQQCLAWVSESITDSAWSELDALQAASGTASNKPGL